MVPLVRFENNQEACQIQAGKRTFYFLTCLPDEQAGACIELSG
jgi:hypothetical protein